MKLSILFSFVLLSTLVAARPLTPGKETGVSAPEAGKDPKPAVDNVKDEVKNNVKEGAQVEAKAGEKEKAKVEGKVNDKEAEKAKEANKNAGNKGEDKNQEENKDNGKANNGTAGALYFLTNEPDGNFIISNGIDQDGKLSLGVAFRTGGVGSHGVSDPIGPDPLFSQGAIKVSKDKLFAVNAGSSTISTFSIDPKDPRQLKQVGVPIGTGGEFPVSLAISKKTGQVCVLNGGRVNGVSCFKQDEKLGLVPIDDTERPLNLKQTTPPSGPAGSVSHIIFSEDDTKLIASVKGVPPKAGFLASWDIDEKTGKLSKNFVKNVANKGALLPFGMSVIPGKDAVLATDPSGGFDIFDFRGAKANRQGKGSAAVQALTVDGQKAVCWTSFSKKTGSFYLTDIGTSIITEVNVSGDQQLKAKIVKQYPQNKDSSTIDSDIASIKDKDFLYVLAPGTQSILAFSLDAPGQAKPIQELKFGDAAKKAGLKTDTNNLQGITVFTI